MNTSHNLSAEALKLFLDLADDASNWSGMPLFGGNVPSTPESKGYLTKLKKAGLVTTEQDEDNRRCHWVTFTEAGKLLAHSHGINSGYWS